MKREDFKKIIKLRSCWKIDKRRGNYRLPNGRLLTTYIEALVEQQMNLDDIRIANDGNLYFAIPEYPEWKIMEPYGDNEICSFEEQWMRIDRLVREIVG